MIWSPLVVCLAGKTPNALGLSKRTGGRNAREGGFTPCAECEGKGHSQPIWQREKASGDPYLPAFMM